MGRRSRKEELQPQEGSSLGGESRQNAASPQLTRRDAGRDLHNGHGALLREAAGMLDSLNGDGPLGFEGK